MRVVSFSLFFAFTLTASIHAFAHGEDTPGPHGGFIRMPGAFHTELLKLSKTSFKVYLLDIQWRNPTVLRSSVTAIVKTKATQEAKAPCKPTADAFVCSLPRGLKWADLTEIIIEANRDKNKGGPASYKIPLCEGSDPKC